MNHASTRGFTLIELLVVIAIIGVLASVVMTSLSAARGKGEDAAVRSNLNAAREQAVLFHDTNLQSFEGVCDDTAATDGMKTIYGAVLQAVFATGGTGVGTGPTTLTNGTCNDDVAQWAAEAALRTGGYFCVDNLGTATTSATPLLDSMELVCE